MTGQLAACPQCTAVIHDVDRFCESCGAALSEVHRVAVPGHGRTSAEPCSDCGSESFLDDYCAVCGHRRVEPDREDAELGGIALTTDRGREHVRNEDAAAAAILVSGHDTAPHAIAVAVCDGVSSSSDAQLASGAAASAGTDAMVAALALSRNVRAAVLAGLTAAAEAAAAASAGSSADPGATPSCTYTAAAIIPDPAGTAKLSVGNVGDSRAYWLPHPPGRAEQLTVDDTVAQELMSAGVAADSEVVRNGAHTLTRWLGVDGETTPWPDSTVTEVTVTGPGSVLLCSDGLWNYLPEAADIAHYCTGNSPADAAHALTEYALQAGGEDNITVAVIPIGDVHELT